MFTEEDLLPISALQHLVFCERQCALIHIEQVWQDNALTVEGSRLHRRTDEEGPRREVRGDVVILRSLPLRSLHLGITGRADIVEFHRAPETRATGGEGVGCATGVELRGLRGRWRPYPVEYKRGKPKRDPSDRIQLCAQAICLEEMLNTEIPKGAIFYGRRLRRTEVSFDPELRQSVETTVRRLRELITSGMTPGAKKLPKCDRCSLIDACVPRVVGSGRSAEAFLSEALSRVLPVEGDLS